MCPVKPGRAASKDRCKIFHSQIGGDEAAQTTTDEFSDEARR
jgi:hypothetical protein